MNIQISPPEWMKDIRAIAFDKDGTFIDFAQTWGGALNLVIDELSPDAALGERIAALLGFDRRGVNFDPHSTFVGGSQDVYGPHWAKLLGVAHNDAFRQRIADSFETHVFSTLRMIEGAETALRRIAGLGLPMGVATNDAIRATERQLAHLRLAELFRFVAGYDSGYGPKPSGAMIAAFAREAGVAPGDVLMVGDSINDARAGRDAGARVVGLRTGPEAHPDFERLCDVVLPSLRDLPAFLEFGRN
jgi:phosphoglycolate phosphatase